MTAISGLVSEKLVHHKLLNKLPNLHDEDPAFQIGSHPATILDLWIDSGILSAHRTKRGAIAVKWLVTPIKDAHVTLTLEDLDRKKSMLELHPETEQLTIANAPATDRHDEPDFVLYRKLSDPETVPPKSLEVPQPRECGELGGIDIEFPEGTPLRIRTPFVDCSGAGYP